MAPGLVEDYSQDLVRSQCAVHWGGPEGRPSTERGDAKDVRPKDARGLWQRKLLSLGLAAACVLLLHLFILGLRSFG